MSTPVAPSSLSSFDLIGVGAPIMDLVATVPESFLEHTAGDKGGSVNISPDEIARLIALLPRCDDADNRHAEFGQIGEPTDESSDTQRVSVADSDDDVGRRQRSIGWS